VAGVEPAELAEAARLSSLADQTPEGRSIVALCAAEYGLAPEATADEAVAGFVPFTAQTRMSGLDVDGREIRKGAANSVLAWANTSADEISAVVDRISDEGGTPLAVAVRSGGA